LVVVVVVVGGRGVVGGEGRGLGSTACTAGPMEATTTTATTTTHEKVIHSDTVTDVREYSMAAER